VPDERAPLRMNGPSKSARDEIGKSIRRMERLSTVAGGTVVIGVLIEVWPDILGSFLAHRVPHLETIGAIIVAFGVAIEVLMASRIARKSESIQELADREIAEVYDRAKHAEKEAAEANLARAKIEQRMQPRTISAEGSEEIKELLGKHSKKHLDVVVFDQYIPETAFFAAQVFALFRSAEWHVSQYEPIGGQHRIPGPPLIIAAAIGAPSEFRELALSIHELLSALDIECGLRLESFGGLPGEFTPGTFRLMRNEPLRVFGATNLGPLRIQIGEKTITQNPREHIVRARPAK
jgi:HAMP domain-containing protein